MENFAHFASDGFCENFRIMGSDRKNDALRDM